MPVHSEAGGRTGNSGGPKRLLQEVYRRERDAGNSRHSLLWTGHDTVAHRLYSSPGYADVYPPGLQSESVTSRAQG